MANGGTGASTLTGLLQGNGTSAITGVTGTAGQFPYYNGANTLLATSTLFLATTGKIGVGVTNPGSKLQVVGDFRFGTNGTYTDLTMGTDSALAGYNQTNYITPVTVPGSGTSKTALYLKNAVSAGTNQMDLIVDGNVGIGTTNPGNLLALSYSSNTTFNGISIQNIGLTAGSAVTDREMGSVDFQSTTAARHAKITGYVPANASGIDYNALKFIVSTAGTDNTAMVIRETGNVGIGTTTPGALLHVEKNTNANIGQYIINTSTGVSAAEILYLSEDTSPSTKSLGIFHSNTNYPDTGIVGPSSSYIDSFDVGGLWLGSRNAAGTVHFFTGGTAADKERMTITSTGNVGIGTTTPASKLDVRGDALIEDDATGLPTLSVYGYGTGNTANAGSLLVLSTDEQSWRINNSYQAGNNKDLVFRDQTNGLNVMTLQPTTGNVGIGTTSPSQKLEVAGNMAFSANPASTRYLLVDQNGTGTTKLIVQAGAGSAAYGGAINLYGQADTSKPGWVQMGIGSGAGTGSTEGRFTVNNQGLGAGTDLFTVLRTGNVGIGTTTPGSLLQVAGATSPQITISDTNAGTDADSFNIRSDSGTLSLRSSNDLLTSSWSAMDVVKTSGGFSVDHISLYTGVSGTERVRIDTNGNVGIGTTTPDRRLMVSGGSSGSNTGIFAIQQSGGSALNSGASVEFSGKNGSSLITDMAIIGTLLQNGTAGSETSDLAFSTKGSGTLAERMRITGAGNVGIGTTTPGAKLQIDQLANSGNINLFSNSIIGTSARFTVSTDNNNSVDLDVLRSNGASVFKVAGHTGFVGIGSTTPGSLLSIGGNGTGWNFFDNSTTTSYAKGIDLKNGGCFSVNGVCLGGGSGTGNVLSGTAGQFPYYAAAGTTLTATSTLFLATTGNIGVGTAVPANELTVRGSGVGFGDTIFRVERAVDGLVAITAGFGKDGTNSMFLGTATNHPFVLTSNDTERMRIDTTGNVGIGTTTSWGQLSASSTSAYPTLAIEQKSTGPAAIFTGGNVGIGTVNPLQKLVVSDGSNNNFEFVPSATPILQTYDRDASAYLPLTMNSLSFNVVMTGNVDGQDFAVDTSKLVVKGSSGYVGIGIAAPTTQLDVRSTGQNTAVLVATSSVTTITSGSNPLTLSNSDQTNNNWANLSFNDGAGQPGSASVSAQLIDHTNNYGNLAFWTRGSSTNGVRMQIDSNGNVGIGTTNPTLAKLQVDGTIAANNMDSVSGTYSTLGYQFGEARGWGYNSADDAVFLNGAGGVIPLIFKNSAALSTFKVGIGTTNPNFTLEVNGTASTTNFFASYATTTNSTSTSLFATTGTFTNLFGNTLNLTNLLVTGSTTLQDFTFNNATGTDATTTNLYVSGTASTTNLRANTALLGNVGIGTTTSLTEALTIDGNIKLNSNTLSAQSITLDSETSIGLRVTNPNGYVSITPLNTSGAHIYTSLPRFYFNVTPTSINGAFSAYSTADLSLQTGSGAATRMTIQATTGNVGIGTTTPSTLLNVYGDASFGQIAKSAIFIRGSAGTAISFNRNPTSGSITNTGAYSYQLNHTESTTNTSDYLAWQIYDTAGSSVTSSSLVLNGVGNVGIGTTTPSTKFSVGGVAGDTTGHGYFTGGLGVGAVNTTAGTLVTTGAATIGGALTLGTDLSVANGGTGASTLTGLLQGNGTSAITGVTGTAGQFPYYNGANTLLATSTIFLATTGDLGIGTNAPTSALTLASGENIRLNGGTIRFNDATGYLMQIANSTDASVYDIGTYWDTTAGVKSLSIRDSYGAINLVPGASNVLSSSYMTIINGGNVGIGTTTPNTKLQVTADSNTGGAVQNSQLSISGATGPTKKLFIGMDTSTNRGVLSAETSSGAYAPITLNPYGGNIGIGTTSPAKKLHVTSSTQWDGLVVENMVGSPQVLFRDASQASNAKVMGFELSGTNLNLETLNDSYGSAVPLVTFQRGGNVGMGTTSPLTKLTVSGSVFVKPSSDIDNGLSIARNSATGRAEITLGDETLYSVAGGAVGEKWRFGMTGAGTDAFSFYDGTQNAISMARGGDVLLVPTIGNVGIHTTIPTRVLQVNATTTSSTAFAANNINTWATMAIRAQVAIQNGATGLIFHTDPNSSASPASGAGIAAIDPQTVSWGGVADLAFMTAVGNVSNERMRISSGGNVGIGTTTPNNKLDIYSTTKSAIGFSGASGSTYKWTMGQDMADGGKFKIASSTALGTSDVMTINGSGYVGIGTTNPFASLEVNGTIRNTSGTQFVYTNNIDVISPSVATTLFNSATGATISIGTAISTGNIQIGPSAGGIKILGSGSNGYVGIGSTTPGTLLSIGGNGTGWNFVDNGTTTSNAKGINLANGGCFAMNGVCISGGGGGSGTVGSGTAGQFPYYAAGGTTLTATSSIFVNTTNSNIGIGTTNPASTLEVQNSSSGGVFRITNGAGSFAFGVDSLGGYAQSATANKGMWFYDAAGTGFMGIDGSTHNVGIGTTSPAAVLQTYGTTGLRVDVTGTTDNNTLILNQRNGYGIGGRNMIQFAQGSGAPLSTNMRFGYDGTAGGLQVRSSANAALATFLNGGNVGIGITNPGYLLNVNSASANVTLAGFQCAAGGFCQTIVTDGTRTVDFGVSSTAGYMGTNSADDLQIRTGAAAKITILNASGNVGIGVANPAQKLTVGATNGQTNALVSARAPSGGNSFEFGHGNTAGYASTIGAETSSGKPFVAFNSEAGTTANTYMTRGIQGTVIRGDVSGGLSVLNIPTASADNQAGSTIFTLSAAGLINGQTISSAASFTGTVNATTGYKVGGAAATAGNVLRGDGTNFVSATLGGGDITGAALTKTDDTNVTLTLGGTPATSLLRAASMTLGWTGTLAVSRGGTGVGTLTGLLQGNGTSAITAVTGTAGQFPYYNGANTLLATSTLFASTNSYIGIGTASPGAKLDVYSPIDLGVGNSGVRANRPASLGQYAFMDYGFNSSMAYFGSVYTGSAGVYGSMTFRQYTQAGVFRDPIIIDTNGNITTTGTINGQTISSAANFTGTVAVASTLSFATSISGNSKIVAATADAYLRINQANQFSSGIWLGTSALRMQSSTLEVGSTGGVGEVTISGSNADATNRITINGNANANSWFNTGGFVGIGTTTPGYKLSINASNATDHLFQVATTTNQQIFTIDTTGNVGIGTSSSPFKLDVVGNGAQTARIGLNAADTLVIGGGQGKISVFTFDPIYSIGDVNYATYGLSTIGIKEETTDNVYTTELVPNVGYKHTIDFKTSPEASDLWLFARAVNIRKHINQMSVLLSAGDNARTWYTVDPNNYTLTIYSSKPTLVSYRLSAPRLDADKWSNFNHDFQVTGYKADMDFSDLTFASSTASTTDAISQEFQLASLTTSWSALDARVSALELTAASTTASLSQLSQAIQDQNLRMTTLESNLADLTNQASTTLATVQTDSQRISDLENLIASSTVFMSATSTTATSSSFMASVMDSISQTFASATTYFKDVVVEAFTVGKADKPTGITFYDSVTGDPYCLKVTNGVQITSAGVCTASAPSAPITTTTTTASTTITTDTTTASSTPTTTDTTTATSTAPIVTDVASTTPPVDNGTTTPAI
ncbi:MAG: hypothetical protein WAV25_00345 [Minisyncoccia bacterium]